MKSFNKTTCLKLRADLNKILAKYSEEEGIKIELGNMRFSASEVKITSVVCRVEGMASKEESALAFQMERHGLKDTNSAGDQLIEYSARRYAYPFVYINARNGKRYKASLAQIKRSGF